MKLTEEDLRIFQDKGYWISPKLFDDNLIEQLRHEVDRIFAGDHDGDGYPMNGTFVPYKDPYQILKIDNAFWINKAVKTTVTSPILGRIAAQFMNTDKVLLWHDQVISKPGAGDQITNTGNVGWHQDFGYWQCSSTTNMVTAWIALQDTDLTNGGMTTIVGSHKWGLIPDSNTFFDQDMDVLKQKYANAGREWIEEPCIMKAGQVSFHHSLTFHGSGPNRTNAKRKCIVSHLMPNGTAYRPGIQYHPNIRLMGPHPYAGQLFDNEYFPVVYDSAQKQA